MWIKDYSKDKFKFFKKKYSYLNRFNQSFLTFAIGFFAQAGYMVFLSDIEPNDGTKFWWQFNDPTPSTEAALMISFYIS